MAHAHISRRPWLAATLWLAFLGPFFFLVYGACNWITDRRFHDDPSSVGTCYFAWEQSIPFVPLFILPYMSIDLFFAGATFLCRDRRELHTLVRRILCAITISGCCFLLFPLRYGWSRPAVDGWLGLVFTPLNHLDQPYNLAPSLHISLRSIIWTVYGLHLGGLWRSAVRLWFLLIGASTLLVYQHHVIDIVGGEIVTLLCFYLFPSPTEESADASRPTNTNRQIGALYAVLASVCLLPAYVGHSWGVLLAWPAVALAILASGYLGFGPAIFRKRHGRLSWSARLLLAPYLLGAYVSSRYFRRQGRLHDEVAPGIVLGCRLTDAEAEHAIAQGVHAVLDLTAEYSECARFLQLPYRNVPILDLTQPTPAQMEAALAFLRHHVKKGKVYVHCALGRSRSAIVVAAFLAAEGMTLDEARAAIRRARPQVLSI